MNFWSQRKIYALYTGRQILKLGEITYVMDERLKSPYTN